MSPPDPPSTAPPHVGARSSGASSTLLDGPELRLRAQSAMPVPRAADPSILLWGMMGSGKSTVAARLAARLEWPVIDTDAVVEQVCGDRVAAIFAARGEAYFRTAERAVLAALPSHGAVVSLGGGAVASAESRALLVGRGLTVWLDAPAALLAARTSGESRPLLAGLSARDRETRLAGLLAERRAAYAGAMLRVDAAAPIEAVVDTIVAARPRSVADGG